MSTKNRDMSKNNCDDCFTKRLVIITGDKGGVGKSTLSRALLHFYTSKEIPCIAFECDTRNPQLERHFKKNYRSIIGNVNFFNKGGSDTLLDDIDQNDVPVFLVDLPAQSGVFFEKFVKEFDLFKSLKRDLKCNITLVSVISRTLDSVNLLDNLYNFCGDVPDYIVVKNLFFGETADKFERYNESPIRGTMQAIGMKEACLPELFYKTFDFLDKNSLTFDDIKNMENVRFSLKSRVAAWLNELSTELELANSLLGLDNKSKVGYYLPIIQKSLEEWEEEQKKENLDEVKETPVA